MSEATKKRGELIVLSGPSGAGKSTVIAELLSSRPDIHFSVSFTTRQPRVGEENGVNYNFVSREEFERMIAADELLEYAEYVGNYYGTSLKVIREQLDRGVDVLLDIEVQGAAKVKEKCPEAVTIFLIPPSVEELSRRLHGRHTDGEDAIAQRLAQAREECRECHRYDYLVVNDTVVSAAHQLQSILEAERCRTPKQLHLVESFLHDQNG